MRDINFTYFEIDAADIWAYECDQYDQTGENFPYYRELYIYLQQFYTTENHTAFVSLRSIKNDTSKEDYYNRQKKLLDDWKKSLFTFFEKENSLYNMLVPCPIKKDNYNREDFQKLFVLKLSQYRQGLLFIREFLEYQLKNSFENDFQIFQDFVNIALQNGEPLLEERVQRQVIEEMNIIRKSCSLLPQNEPEYLFPRLKELDENIPKGYSIVPGRLDIEQVMHFFSFLYLEESANKKPFLAKEAVMDIFKYGIAIPPYNVPVKKYKLNCSHYFPKGIVDYALHRFYTIYEYSNGTKTRIVEFFGSYLYDYEGALKSKTKLDQIARNMTGSIPERMNFTLDKYVPAKIDSLK